MQGILDSLFPQQKEVVESVKFFFTDGKRIVKDRAGVRSDFSKLEKAIETIDKALNPTEGADSATEHVAALVGDYAATSKAMEVYGFCTSKGRFSQTTAWTVARDTAEIPYTLEELGWGTRDKWFSALEVNGDLIAVITSAVCGFLSAHQNVRGAALSTLCRQYRVVLRGTPGSFRAYVMHVSDVEDYACVNLGEVSAYLFWGTTGSLCIQTNKDARKRPVVFQERVSALVKMLFYNSFKGAVKIELPVLPSNDE